ncbi:MAG: hypothetical protein LLF76_10265 [Planctomycetaceae bacterium]|nr:hypothetical protein [Planctomycetaceae bacterium]
MAHKTIEQLGREIETFQNEISKIQTELADMAEATDPEFREKLRQKSRHIRDVISGLKSQTGQKAANAYNAVRQGSITAIGAGRSQIEQRPFMAILTAFAAGLLLSKLFGRFRAE